MKIAVCSDLHLEFGDLDLTNDENADVLILGGDIFVAEDVKNFNYVDEQIMAATPSMLARGERYYNFVKRCSERFPQVILIMGNHEHYHGDYAKTASIIRTVVGELVKCAFLRQRVAYHQRCAVLWWYIMDRYERRRSTYTVSNCQYDERL
jgi:3',5'-cyclic AMP phosphodiesterase CpdA